MRGPGLNGGAPLDGFWLPTPARDRVLREVEWDGGWLGGGRIASEPVEGAVAVRWPRLDHRRIDGLLDLLLAARRVPATDAVRRWERALDAIRPALMEIGAARLDSIARAAGHSPQMLAVASAFDGLVQPGMLAAALEATPTWASAGGWTSLAPLPGILRFFPDRWIDRMARTWRAGSVLGRPRPEVPLTLGFGAGNVPGTGLLMAMLGGVANHRTIPRSAAPAVLVRNSRLEPLFTPMILTLVESVDPDLVAATAVMVWDYDDRGIQQTLMRAAGLLIAAAGDDAIGALERDRRLVAPDLPFHAHGHKVSFAVVEEHGGSTGLRLDQLAMLGALDSCLWDQMGCLSARVHFVAGDADRYADALASAMDRLSRLIPRGAVPSRWRHRAFDTYSSLPAGLPVRVCSRFEQESVVVCDGRPWDADALRRAVNACQGRVAVVRPVSDVMDVASHLGTLPATMLQSVSVAMDQARVEAFAGAVGGRGVTAIRALGRAAFPRLAYSWDGWLPIDTGWERPPGHYTTVEFDDLRATLRNGLERVPADPGQA